jgi:hypothetical protein
MADQCETIETGPPAVPISSVLPIAILSVLAAMGTLATDNLPPSLPRDACQSLVRFVKSGLRRSANSALSHLRSDLIHFAHERFGMTKRACGSFGQGFGGLPGSSQLEAVYERCHQPCRVGKAR